MVLESTIICADTSEFMRNGDFLPTRIQAQQDAVNLVCLSKTRSNPENNVGLLTMSPNVKVLVTMTTDVGRILATLHQVQPAGNLNFMTGIRVAHLALKHRQGKNHRMRIVAFVGSPIENDDKELTKLAKKLKKEKVSVDVINFGEDGFNSDKLNSFIEIINGAEGTGSHLVTIPPGTLLSDALMNSPIIVGEDGSGAVPGLPGTGGGGEYEFGFDPSADPELAMALRISMEEQRQRQEEEARNVMDQSASDATPTVPTTAEPADSEEALLKQAIAMSMQPDAAPSSSLQETPIPDFGAMTEDEQIAYAMQMSLQASEIPGEGDKDTPMETETPAPSAAQIRPEDSSEDYAEVMSDPSFLQSVLENLPGVDPTSEAVRNVMGTLVQQQQNQEEEEKKKKEDKDKK